MVAVGPTDPARLPPAGLDGLEPSWSRLVEVPLDDTIRTFHLLDTHAQADASEIADTVGLTVLCVHGNPSWSFLWRNVLHQLPDGVRGVAVDHLNMGFSDRTGTVRRLADRVDDLCALTDELGIAGPVVTIAHDWGGPISLGWAQRHIPQLRGVVLTNTAVHQPEGAPAPKIIRATRSRAALRRATVDTTAFITGAFEMSHPRLPKHIRKGFLAPYETADRREAIETFVEDIPLEADHPTAATLDGIAAGCALLGRIPTLLLWGSRDLVFSDLYLHDLEARFPHADVHRWGHAGHFVGEDADVASAAVDWINALDTDAQPADADLGPTSLLAPVYDPDRADRTAIVEMVDEQATITFGQLRTRIEETAAGLAHGGIEAGDRVALMIPPGIDMVATLFAIWRVGAVAVLVDGALKPKQMTAALNAAYPSHLIGINRALAASRALRWPGKRIAASELSSVQRRVLGVTDNLDTMRSSAPVLNLPLPPASAEAAVVFTSGSTGPSKGVRYSHARLAMQRDLIASLYDITSEDSLVAAFAPFALYGPLLGITSTVPDMDVSAPGSIETANLARAVDAIDATMVFASPAALERLVETANEVTAAQKPAMANVRTLLSAGAPVRASLLTETAALFPNAVAHTPYGMTEALPVASINLPDLIEAGSGPGVCVGRVAPGVELHIDPIDHSDPIDDDSPEFGEIIVRAPHQRLGYDRLWHTTHLASDPPGWHRTGDVGQLDAEGRLWVGGRLRHVVWTPSGPVGPVAIEKMVEELSDVYMAAVVGVGPVGNQQLVVVVERMLPPKKPALASLSLIDDVRSVAGHDVVAVFDVPKLPVDRRHNSKIDRTAVAEWADGVLAGGPLRGLAKEA